MEERNRVQTVLSSHGIESQFKTENPSARVTALSSRRGHVGSLGVDPDAAYEYKIYVHSKNYEQAKSLL